MDHIKTLGEYQAGNTYPGTSMWKECTSYSTSKIMMQSATPCITLSFNSTSTLDLGILPVLPVPGFNWELRTPAWLKKRNILHRRWAQVLQWLSALTWCRIWYSLEPPLVRHTIDVHLDTWMEHENRKGNHHDCFSSGPLFTSTVEWCSSPCSEAAIVQWFLFRSEQKHEPAVHAVYLYEGVSAECVFPVIGHSFLPMDRRIPSLCQRNTTGFSWKCTRLRATLEGLWLQGRNTGFCKITEVI